ncbi:MAG TPA: GNAT family N-acetyltransferase [Patescibacteria group bacterium]|nr:GNAT family N-acetyltransferase [Patescibacteria group bacterium]
MPDGTKAITIRPVSGIDHVAAAEWDACAGPDNPFLSHAFLSALEQSGSAAAKSGWAPRHLLAEDADGHVMACAPLYVKSHSFGEYVFDWSWAEAWQRAGHDYYPKLQCAVPFTPVAGPRLLVRPQMQGLGLDLGLAAAMVQMTQAAGLSSAHMTFSTEAEARALAAQGWLLRMGEQYHWRNDGYACFDDFLAALSSRKRKTIRKERERANGLGVDILTLTGADIKARHWDAFHRFYLDTVEKKWAHAYLTRDFFARLGEAMADRVVLIMAEQDGRLVAGALNLRGGDTLYGRNWGAEGEFKYLHFEMCYYRAIDFAIEHGLARVEAGAQGEHKVSRGYLPVPTWSAHWIREAPLRAAVAGFLEREREAVAENIRELAEAGPFRDGGGG